MRLVVVSDTHARHEDLGSLEGDVLIHCGDFCNGLLKDPRDLEGLDFWFGKQRFELVLCVGGNHDFVAEDRVRNGESVFRNAVWLQDTAHVHQGITFYGSPWLPHLRDWAFYLPPEELRDKWSMIPDHTDVLITHTPPFGILDQPRSRQVHCGCRHLLERVDVVKPRFHLFGHTHASAGLQENGFTTFVNASLVDRRYRVARSPVRLDLDDGTASRSQ